MNEWSDGVRWRVVACTAQCVRVVCSVSVLFVCTLFASGALHEVSPHWPLPARLPKGRDLSALHGRCPGHTHSPNSCVRSTGIPSHLLSPGLQGTKAASARCVNPCLADLLRKSFWLFSVQRHRPWWPPSRLRAAFHRSA